MTYYPVFKDVRKIIQELLLLLTLVQGQKKVNSEVPIIGFKNTKSLKDHLVRATLPQLDREDRSKPCEEANHSCEVRDSVKDTTKFKKAESEVTFDILKGPVDCNAKNMICLFECKKCQFKFPYVGSTVTRFRLRCNNYKSTYRKCRKKLKKGNYSRHLKNKLKKKLFHEHYCSDMHESVANWCVPLTDQVEEKKELRKKEL